MGNNYYSVSELQNFMVLKKNKNFSTEQLNLDCKSIKLKYKESGFLFADVKISALSYFKDSSFVDISMDINEGNKILIGKISLNGNVIFPNKEILNSFETKVGSVLYDNILNNDIKELLMRYENKGYPFVKIFVENVSVYEDSGKFKLSVNLNIFEEKTVQINQIKIKGNELTNDNVITREIKLGKDKTISTDILQNIKTRLERLNIFEKVEDPKIYKPKNSNLANLLIEVKEGNPNNFDGILGYVPPATDNDNGYFTGLVKLSFKNIFGTARKIDARWQQEVKSTQELEFKYTEPYLLGYPVYGNLGFLQRIQDTTYTRRKIDLKCDVLFSDKFIVSLSSGFDRIIPSTDSTRIFKIADSRILYGAAELRYDNRDNIFIPGSGGEYKIYYSYGNKRIYNISEFQNLGYSEFFSVQKYSAEIEFYLSPFKRITNLIKGFIGEVKSDKLEDADFFRIGGIKNIRGYREEQFLASDLFYSNLELRYSVSRKSFLFGFYDFGYYSKPEDNLNHISSQKAFLFGYGLGIRLETPLGLVSISYALGKGDGILDGKIHFGYINDF